MENNIPLLSICIPTYNREVYLRVSLKALISEIRTFDQQIEIVVSDNASTDETKKVVEEMQKEFPDIVYSRNEENLGYDRNLDKAIRLARGKYCWFLSDDEIVLSGSISRLLDIIKTYPDAAYFCFDVRGNTISHAPDKELTYLNSGVDLLREYGVVGGLISQNIILRELYPKNTEKYYGNLWIHLSIIFEIIYHKPLVLIDASFARGQRDVCTWAKGGKALYTYTSLRNIILSWKTLGYPVEVIDNLVEGFHKTFPETLVSAKIQGLEYNYRNLRYIFTEYRNYPFQLLSGIMIFFLPSSLMRFLKKILGK